LTTMFKRLQGVPPRQYLSDAEFEARHRSPMAHGTIS